jgi:L-lactate dehydrogenase complex protein LldG
MSRTRMLSNVRAACRSLRHHDTAAGSDGLNDAVAVAASDDASIAPPINENPTKAALLAQFKTAAEAVGVHVKEIKTLDTLATAVDAIASETGTTLRTFRVGDPQWQHRLKPLASSRVEVRVGAGGADDDASLSEAICAIADSGSVVLASGPNHPTTLAFLPTLHLVVVDVDQVVASLDDAMKRIGERLLSEPPRAVNIITGASRTGDLGGKIVAGAHGPKHLGVILYTGE